jgi:hypothetical protein
MDVTLTYEPVIPAALLIQSRMLVIPDSQVTEGQDLLSL